jgi:hypothetical protein
MGGISQVRGAGREKHGVEVGYRRYRSYRRYRRKTTYVYPCLSLLLVTYVRSYAVFFQSVAGWHE